MTDLWVRQISDDTEQPRYRWYDCDSAEQGSCTLSAMAERWPEATLTLLIAGTVCPSRRLSFKPEEKRHLARLVPYELEADLAQDVSGLHVALGSPLQATSTVVVSYIDSRELGARIRALETAGFDVRHCYAEPLLLPVTVSAWVLRVTGSQVDICWDTGAAASVDLSMLGVLLDAMLNAPAAAAVTPPKVLHLQALTQPELDSLRAQVAASMLTQTWQPELVTTVLAGVWEGICQPGTGGGRDSLSPAIPDLRQGEFARPVRWQKIWRPLRLPLMAAGLAALTFAAVTLLEIQLNNQRFRNLQQDIESAYREVVPAGVLVDAEQQLRAQLGQLRGNTGGGSVLALLDRITPRLVQNTQISINRLSYSGSNPSGGAGELQLSIAADSNTDILQFSEQLNNSGLQARAQNMTQSGSQQQANLIVTGVAP
ncbi:MAG: hypothetical protein CMQ34_13705 [Gammaproteobacteria bacterium]|nr:hypothetical protein [Gammaproteobacteria bacterium]